MRSLGGFYTVISEDGTKTECRGRGIFRKDATTLLVGDRCRFEPTEPGCGSITAIEPRKNTLQRPPVANLDRLAMVVSLADPAPNALVIDQLTAIAARRDIPVVMIFTKPDLADPTPWAEIYRKAGYPTAVVNNLTGKGLTEAAALLKGGITAFCGNSGAGKSSLMNGLYPELKLATGEISKKLGRGRHTTRHVELFPDGHGGWLCDTPGFSALEFAKAEPMPAAELAEWLAGMKRRHPALNIAVSDFSIHLHTVWMFTLFEEIIMHRVKPREMKQVIAEYIRFETTGWKELMKI